MTIEKNGAFNKARLETFSDGIFVIIITLLVLELRVPYIIHNSSVQELSAALISLIPKIISWVISFYSICVIWVNHHRLFESFKEISNGIFWWNAFLLLWVCFIPFPTAMMGDYHKNFLAVLIYGVVLGMKALSFSFMRLYVNKNTYILHKNINVKEFRKGSWLSLLTGPLPYFMGAILSVAHPYFSFAIYLLIPIFSVFPSLNKGQVH